MSKSKYAEEGSCKPNSSTAHGNLGGKVRDTEESSRIEQTKQNNEGRVMMKKTECQKLLI